MKLRILLQNEILVDLDKTWDAQEDFHSHLPGSMIYNIVVI